jgi:hypothetical protein
MDDYNIIRIFCSHEKPLFLPYYVPDKLFIIEVARQYKFWFHVFYEKRKKQFIPLPWKVGEILLRGIAKIDEFASYFDQYNLKFAEEIKGFDPNHLFYNHMISVGISPALVNTLIFGEEEGDSHDPPIQGIKKNYGDIETIVSTTKHYKQRGRSSGERNAQSPIVSHRSVLPKINSQSTTTQQRKSSNNNSGDDGEKNPPQGNLENPHKLKVKRKRTNSQQEGEEQNIPENNISLEDMDLDVDIENIWFPDEEERYKRIYSLLLNLLSRMKSFLMKKLFLYKMHCLINLPRS